MLEWEEKKHTANLVMQKDASKQQMEMLATCNAGPKHATAETAAAAAVSTTHATNWKLANDANTKIATGNARIIL
jgi:hypothetical protein